MPNLYYSNKPLINNDPRYINRFKNGDLILVRINRIFSSSYVIGKVHTRKTGGYTILDSKMSIRQFLSSSVKSLS